LRFFHEIGHANEERERESEIKEIEINDEKLEIFINLSLEECREELPFEDKADKYAFDNISQLRRQGIDLEPEMTDEDLQRHIQKRSRLRRELIGL
jgi:hypothetical protein